MPDTPIEDIEFTCANKECAKQDVWEAGEQKFMHRLAADGKIDAVRAPRYCRECRAERKAKKVIAQK